MPKDLAALLVEEGAVPADVVERALARQRENGGALDTALLEEKAIGEDALLVYLARASELPCAPEAAWSGADARARRVFPSRVAERHGLAPFALEGRELSLVATYPVDLGLLDEISFMLSLHLSAHVGPEWRVRALIHRLYGTPLQPRLVALCGAPLAAEDAPPPAALPEEPPPAPPPPVLSGFARDDAEPLEPLAAALAQALESVDPLSLEEGPEGEGEPMGQEGEERGRAPEAPADRSAPPRWSLDAARAALSTARHRDDVVLAALRYARDFFEFAAMFAVTRDAVAGHDALGAEEARARARDVAIWSSDPGIFRTVIETESPYLGPVVPGAAGTDAVLHGLGRTPRTVLVYPVLLRHRPVCILYADNGEAPVSPRRLGDLLLFLSGLGPAFERIIVDRKGGPRQGSPQEPTPAAAQTAQTAAVVPEQPVPAVPAAAVAEPGPVAAEEREPDPAAVASAETEQTLPRAGGAIEPARRGAEEGGGAPPSPPAEPLPPEPEPEQAAADSLAALDERLFVEPREVAAPERSAQQPAVPEEQAEPPAAGAPLPEPEPGAVPAAPVPPEASRAPPSPPELRPAPAPTPPPVAAPPDPATLCALADRALDADVDIASAACAALGARRRDRAIRQASERLRRALLSGISGRSARAARAIGALRDVEAIPLLIQVLETSEPETAQAAADALAAITLQRIGPDARRWLGWWKANRGRGRAEWLFSGLTSAERETRVAASVELSLAAPPPVAYSADMPPAEREKAARAWAGWWTRSGNVL